jgi:hypothetical protein
LAITMNDYSPLLHSLALTSLLSAYRVLLKDERGCEVQPS